MYAHYRPIVAKGKASTATGLARPRRAVKLQCRIAARPRGEKTAATMNPGLVVRGPVSWQVSVEVGFQARGDEPPWNSATEGAELDGESAFVPLVRMIVGRGGILEIFQRSSFIDQRCALQAANNFCLA